MTATALQCPMCYPPRYVAGATSADELTAMIDHLWYYHRDRFCPEDAMRLREDWERYGWRKDITR